MTVPQALYFTIAIYVLLAILLLSLNILSLWRWWVKAIAIVLTCLCFVFSYFTITAMIGWPTFTPLPKRFNLVATRVIEPNQVENVVGHVYLWVEEIDENNVPIGAPRGYEVAYSSGLASNAEDAQSKIDTGQEVMGQTVDNTDESAKPNLPQTTQQGSRQGENNGAVGQGALTAGDTTAADTIGEGAEISFSDMPATKLPDKAAIVVPDLSQQR